MKKKGLIPNKSYDIFVLGDNISNYLHLPHRIDFYDDDPYICHDTYYFDNFNFKGMHVLSRDHAHAQNGFT
jgi:hypothetical protein